MKNSYFEFAIDSDANCAFSRHFGLLDMESILERGNAVLGHKDFCRDLNRLVDVTNCEIGLCSDDIRRIANSITGQGDLRGRYKEAILVDSPLSHGMARVFDSLSTVEYVEYQIFNSDNSAVAGKVRDWLELPPDYIFPEFLAIS